MILPDPHGNGSSKRVAIVAESYHYTDVIMTMMASQITSLTVVYSTVYQTQIKENIKAPRHWPLCGEFTGTGEFPSQRASYAENVSIWWRHHVLMVMMITVTGSCPQRQWQLLSSAMMTIVVAMVLNDDDNRSWQWLSIIITTVFDAGLQWWWQL